MPECQMIDIRDKNDTDERRCAYLVKISDSCRLPRRASAAPSAPSMIVTNASFAFAEGAPKARPPGRGYRCSDVYQADPRDSAGGS